MNKPDTRRDPAVTAPERPDPLDKATAGERFRYWLDRIMSRGMIALIGLLGLAGVAVIAVVSLVITMFGLWPDGRRSFDETFWSNLMHALDSGTLGGDEGVGLRAAQLVVTVGGIIVVASLISIISSAFDARVEELRKGRSRVLERDHTLILGWSSKIFPIVNELCLANRDRLPRRRAHPGQGPGVRHRGQPERGAEADLRRRRQGHRARRAVRRRSRPGVTSTRRLPQGSGAGDQGMPRPAGGWG